MFSVFEKTLFSLAEKIPLEFFTFFASFAEEVFPPIPSPSIMIITGFLSSIRGYFLPTLIIFCLIGTIGKTLGAWVIYFIMDKVEDILSTKFGKFIGISHKQIEYFGSHLGRGPRDYFILTLLRALPIFPSTLISVGGGLIKVKLRLFLVSTFIGSFIRNLIYIYLGYIGTATAFAFVSETAPIETFIKLIIILGVFIFLAFLYFKRKKFE